MKISELVFVPAPAIGHLVSMAEMAKLLISRHKNLSITVLVAKFPIDTGVDQYTESLLLNAPARITIVILPETDPLTYVTKPTHTILTALIESQKSNVRDIMSRMTRSDSTCLVGVVADLLCANIMDVANEFSLPTYVYSPAGAGFLGVVFHLQTLQDDDKLEWNELKNSDTELVVPSFSNSVPTQMLPLMFLDKEGGSDLMLSMVKTYRKAKGIIVNTFEELESNAVASLRSDSMLPPIYAVGPILNLNGEGQNADETATSILGWLDDQPPSSVVFLCFGSFGSFQDNQVKEIAVALERSGHRFLWSLRPSMTEGDTKLHLRYQNLDEILPVGFLERTATVGKVIGWAPQVAVLSHNAVGGFVSHCGWNSTMESVWFGVPIATWPIYAEQQLNAFELVKELGLAVEIEVDYRNEFNRRSDVVIGAGEIEMKIRNLMMDGEDNEIRNKAKEMKEKSRVAVAENGSSYTSLAKLIEDII